MWYHPDTQQVFPKIVTLLHNICIYVLLMKSQSCLCPLALPPHKWNACKGTGLILTCEMWISPAAPAEAPTWLDFLQCLQLVLRPLPKRSHIQPKCLSGEETPGEDTQWSSVINLLYSTCITFVPNSKLFAVITLWPTHWPALIFTISSRSKPRCT